MSGARKINLKVFSALFFSKFGSPQRVEVLASYKREIMQDIMLAFSHKETCGNNVCLQDGLWVTDKKVSFPVELLESIIDGLQGIQPSAFFDGKYRIEQVVAELFFSHGDKPKRLEIIACYGQRQVKDVCFVFSSRSRCEERSCDVGEWAHELEVSVASEVLPELVSTLIEIKQEAAGG